MAHSVDKNLIVNTSIGESNVKFYDVRQEPFELYGLYDANNQDVFKRLPDEIGKNTNDGVAQLYLNTAGGRVRFATNSRYVAIKTSMSQYSWFSHMALISTAGFDMYVDDEIHSTSRFYDTFKPSVNMKNGFESKIEFINKQWRYITINFPSYASVSSLHIGLEEDAEVSGGLKYSAEAPIVYYGSSITQGACSSRPGNAYENIICRRTNVDFVNLGFSGSARGEKIIAEYISDMDMSIFVCDFDHNATSAEQLHDRHMPFYRIFREKKPNTPYVMISRPDYHNKHYDENKERRDVIYESYLEARKNGDENVYFIDGSSLFRTVDEDMCTVDSIHPNDYGFYLMAQAIESEIRWIWSKKASI